MDETREALYAQNKYVRGWEFIVPGKPRGKGRPRFRRAGNFVQTYTPAETASYENLIALEYQAVGGVVNMLPVRVEVTAVYPIPKSVSRRDRQMMASGEIIPNCKPDADNVLKAVLDGLNGVAYRDDTCVARAIIDRQYGESPCLRIKVCYHGGRFRK